MASVYAVINSHEGTTKVYKYRSAARAFQKKQREKMHDKYCVNKEVPLQCSCGTPQVVECAAHHYARNVQEHTVKGCPFYTEVYIEEIELQ